MNILISGMSSDIGQGLARLFIDYGHRVIGTYRTPIKDSTLLEAPLVKFIYCDVGRQDSIEMAIEEYAEFGMPWDVFISCVATMEPIGSFFSCDFDTWEASVTTNCLAQLRFLHGIYPLRQTNSVCHVVFFAGGGTNSPFTHYSAYCASKIFLIKMCELLDDEEKDLNTFIIGPGWVRTKIHDQTLANPDGAGGNYFRTLKFLESDSCGASYEEIFELIRWGIQQGRDVAGGRNFSLVHDAWRNGGHALAENLSRNPDTFKLRRYSPF